MTYRLSSIVRTGNISDEHPVLTARRARGGEGMPTLCRRSTNVRHVLDEDGFAVAEVDSMAGPATVGELTREDLAGLCETREHRARLTEALDAIDQSVPTEPVRKGGWYEHGDGTVAEYRWVDGFPRRVRWVASWHDVPRDHG